MGGWEHSEGFYYSNWYTPVDCKTEYLGLGYDFLRELRARYRGASPVTDLYQYGIICEMVFVRALEKALDEVPPDEITGDVIYEYLYTLEDADMMGMTHNVTYIEGTVNRGPNSVRVWLVEEGKVVPATDWFPYPPIQPDVDLPQPPPFE